MDSVGTMAMSVMYDGRKMDRMETMAVSVMYECMRGGRWTGWERWL